MFLSPASHLSARLLRHGRVYSHIIMSGTVASDNKPFITTEPPIGFQVKNVKRSEDLSWLSLPVQGLNFSNYGRDGLPTTQALMHLAECTAFIAFGTEPNRTLLGHDWAVSGRQATLFTLSFQMKMSNAMYKKDIHKANLLCEVECLHVGRTSMMTIDRYFVDGDPVPVLTSFHHLVNVDYITRKPKPWEAWILDKYQDKKYQGPESRMEQFPRPEVTFVYNVFVTWSDTDSNGHCNFAKYTKFANDALHGALALPDSGHPNFRKGPYHQTVTSDGFTLFSGDPSALKTMTNEVVQCGVKEIKMRFYKEAFEGDLLTVHLWQDEAKENVVFCSVERGDEIVTQFITEYHAPQSNL